MYSYHYLWHKWYAKTEATTLRLVSKCTAHTRSGKIFLINDVEKLIVFALFVGATWAFLVHSSIIY